jgi:hypothetical protein
VGTAVVSFQFAGLEGIIATQKKRKTTSLKGKLNIK